MRPSRIALLLLLAFAVLAPTAGAHANYYASEPARGARLASPPGQVVVTLSEDVDPAGTGLEVRDQDGQRVDRGPTQVETGQTPRLTVQLAEIGPGAYTVTWRSLSSVDGHVTSGSFGFAVGSYEPPATSETAVHWDYASAAARILLYAGYALSFGALAFLLWIEPRPIEAPRQAWLRRAFALGALLQTLATLALLFWTWHLAALPWATFVGASQVGQGLVLRVAAALLLLLVAWATQATPQRSAWMLAPLLVLGSLASARFAHSGDAGPWGVVVDWVHLAAASTWIGGLGLFLTFLLTRGPYETMATVRPTGMRFSRVALPAVILLGLSGLVATITLLGWDALRDPQRLLGEPYVLLLSGKIAAFIAMIGLASINRYVFLAHARRTDSNRPRPFRRVVAVEALVGAGVLVLAGFLTSISPPSAEAAGPTSTVYSVAREGDHFNVTLEADPAPAVGSSSNITLQLQDVSTGRPLDNAYRVRLRLASTDEPEQGSQSWVANQTGPGQWTVPPVLFTRAGNYTATVTIQTESVYSEDVALPLFVRDSR